MSTVIKAAGPARFLSLVPHLLGFHPTRSLVLVPFSGRRSVGAMRFDLPSAAGADDVERIASTCIGMVCRLPDANAVALVVYTDHSLHRAACRCLRHRGARRPVRGRGRVDGVPRRRGGTPARRSVGGRGPGRGRPPSGPGGGSGRGCRAAGGGRRSRTARGGRTARARPGGAHRLRRRLGRAGRRRARDRHPRPAGPARAHGGLSPR
ncbi:MAG: DUF4192 family protein [Microbacterium sp.]|nr:DUF4192 family protein [Microbacterium sp.]